LKTFEDIEEFAKSIISKEMNYFEEKQKVRNEMKNLLNEDLKSQVSSHIQKVEHSPPKEEDREDNLIKESIQKDDSLLKNSNLVIEDLTNFLINNIGNEKYSKCYDMFKPLVNTMKGEKNFDIYRKMIQGILNESEEKEYLYLFITLITIEEKLNKGK